MILVTLGTQDKPFTRLLKKIDNLIDKGIIKDKVIVQAGCTKYESNNMEVIDLIPMDEFDNLLKDCDLIITHGGVGTILSALKYKKKIIAVPRLAKYGEHVNDHQIQIITKLYNEGNILEAINLDDLEIVLEKVEKFKPKGYKSNNENMVKLIEELIDKKV